ncbi:MAG: META domain-containing protein [Burkholderiaceae bacterium]|jgi:copper homeostasis protein (lipoprotein)|nr:META domain-containing protein [Burkholderiaceae bacterium]
MIKRYLAALVFPVILAGCACSSDADNTAASASVDAATLTRYSWRLQDAKNARDARIDQLFVQPDKLVLLDFGKERFRVRNTCNMMSGPYSVSDGQINFGMMASTRMMCLDGNIAALDGEVASRLKGNTSYRITFGTHPVLTLITADGDTLGFIGSEAAKQPAAPKR